MSYVDSDLLNSNSLLNMVFIMSVRLKYGMPSLYLFMLTMFVCTLLDELMGPGR